DLVFRTARQVEEALRTSCLAVLPLVTAADALQRPAQQKGAQEPGVRGFRGRQSVARQLPQDQVGTLTSTLMRQVVEEPFSPLAEGVRSIKIAAE
ncbi:hypothetical protein, partial [Acinetobacter baumannii]|uniref:hypothetical protein n=1 Tax=Acinetobacter baumannii TaxID=470 RepID=UPI001BB46508